MIGVVDYGMGNLRSVQKAFEFLGEPCVVSGEQRVLNGCERLVLPGVGSFAAGMAELKRCRLDEYIKSRAADTPILGICLGMQFLLEESDEEGVHAGLSLVSGRAERFKQGKIPHMGWNGVFHLHSPLFAGIPEGTPFYFVHSYYATTADGETLAQTEYYKTFASAVGRGNVCGVQFHPEKSGEAGLALLKNFTRISR